MVTMRRLITKKLTFASLIGMVLCLFVQASLANAQNPGAQTSPSNIASAKSSHASQQKLQRILACRQSYLQSKITDLVACIEKAEAEALPSIEKTPQSQINQVVKTNPNPNTSFTQTTNNLPPCKNTNPFLVIKCVNQDGEIINAGQTDKDQPSQYFRSTTGKKTEFMPHFYFGMELNFGSRKFDLGSEYIPESSFSYSGATFTLGYGAKTNQRFELSASFAESSTQDRRTAFFSDDPYADYFSQTFRVMHIFSDLKDKSSNLNVGREIYYGYGLQSSKITADINSPDILGWTTESTGSKLEPVVNAGVGLHVKSDGFTHAKRGHYWYADIKGYYSQHSKELESIVTLGYSIGRIK